MLSGCQHNIWSSIVGLAFCNTLGLTATSHSQCPASSASVTSVGSSAAIPRKKAWEGAGRPPDTNGRLQGDGPWVRWPSQLQGLKGVKGVQLRHGYVRPRRAAPMRCSRQRPCLGNVGDSCGWYGQCQGLPCLTAIHLSQGISKGK